MFWLYVACGALAWVVLLHPASEGESLGFGPESPAGPQNEICHGWLNLSMNAAVIVSGENSPDDHAHLVSWSMKWELW